MSRRADVVLDPAGSLTLVRPMTQRAEDWIEANVAGDPIWCAGALVVEARYIGDLYRGMVEAGLEVE